MIKKVLLFGVLPLTVIGVGYYFYSTKMPKVKNVSLGNGEQYNFTLNGNNTYLKIGQAISINGWTISAEKYAEYDGGYTTSLYIKKNGSVYETLDTTRFDGLLSGI